MDSKLCVKGIYSRNGRCSTKEAVKLLLSWSILYVAISKCIVSLIQFFFFFFNWLQLIQRESAKANFSWNFRCSTKETVLLLRSWSTLYIKFLNCKVSWFYFFFNFNLLLLNQIASAKIDFSENFRCSVKEAVLIPLSCSTQYIVLLKCKMSWFYFSCCNLPLLTESAYVKFIYFEFWGAPRRKQFYWFYRGASCI